MTLFDGQTLDLKCNYQHQVTLVGKFRNRDVGSSVSTKVDPERIHQFSAEYSQASVRAGDVGQIQCVNSSDSAVLFNWTIETLGKEFNGDCSPLNSYYLIYRHCCYA